MHICVTLRHPRRKFNGSLFTFKCICFNFPQYLKQYLNLFCSQNSLRHTDHSFFFTQRIRKEIGSHTFKFKAPSDWNELSQSLSSITSFQIFKSSLFTLCQTSGSYFWFFFFCWTQSVWTYLPVACARVPNI